MIALVRSEWLKVRTTRGWYAYLAVTILLVGIAVAGDVGSSDDERRSSLDFQLGLVDAAAFASLLAVIVGITIITSEFRHGTITPTLLAEPRRELVVAGKAVTAVLVSLLFALLGLAIAAAVGLPWLSAVGAEIQVGGEIGTRALQVLLVTALWALIGLAVGVLVQSQIAALVGTLIWIFLGETLLIGVFGLLDIDGAAPYLPFQALDAADGSGGADDMLSYWAGVGVSLAWIVILGATGTERLRRRDVT